MAVAVIAFPGGLSAQSNAAHSLANKFAHESDAPTKVAADNRQAFERSADDEARLKADEAEMLERAKAEADERRKADDLADDKAARDRAAREAARIKQADKLRLAHEKDDADRKATEAGKARAAEAEAQRLAAERQELARKDAERKDAERREAERKAAEAETKRLAEKAESERRAAEAEAKRLAEERALAERKAAEAETARLAAQAEQKRLEAAETERRRIAAEKTEADRVSAEAARKRIDEAKQADAQRQMEAAREDEARRLSEKLTRAREQRKAAKDLGEGYSALGNPPSDDEYAKEHDRRPTDRERAAREPRATILLMMEPGSRGIRRYEKTADPIICIGATCYVGGGADAPAVSMNKGRAFGPGNTLGQRAGACRHSLTCAFRDVDVGHGRFEVQPIDLRLLRHDRREAITVEADTSCTAAGGHLRCGRAVQAGSYRIWVVPESVARKVGAAGLDAALAGGLSSAHANLDR